MKALCLLKLLHKVPQKYIYNKPLQAVRTASYFFQLKETFVLGIYTYGIYNRQKTDQGKTKENSVQSHSGVFTALFLPHLSVVSSELREGTTPLKVWVSAESTAATVQGRMSVYCS